MASGTMRACSNTPPTSTTWCTPTRITAPKRVGFGMSSTPACPTPARCSNVACGTGQHLAHLQTLYACQGVDIDDRLAAVATARCQVPIHVADMDDFDLGDQFDVVTVSSRRSGTRGVWTEPSVRWRATWHPTECSSSNRGSPLTSGDQERFRWSTMKPTARAWCA